MSGANLVSVQKLLGHSNPKITAETYAHLAPDYLLAEVNLLRFGVDHLAPVAKTSQRLAAASTIRVTPELQSASDPAGEAGPPSLVPEGFPASEMVGCTGLEPVASGVTGSKEGVAETGSSSYGTIGNRFARSTDFCPGLGGLFRRRVTPGLQSARSQDAPWPRLLSVREAARLLGVCTSTVYKLCAEGKLRHVRISNAIRISESALAAYT